MKIKFWLIYLFIFSFCIHLEAQTEGECRQPAVAGKFYPENTSMLKNALKFYFENAVSPGKEKPVGIITPHAGYIYSGQIAADAWNQTKPFNYDIIIFLGTNHTSHSLKKISVYNGEGYKTPLGTAQIDPDITAELLKHKDIVEFDPDAHKNEHSIEVQIPFAQTLFPGAKIVTAIVGVNDPELAENFAELLYNLLKEKSPLFVASSDLSHYPPLEVACAADSSTLKIFGSGNAEKIFNGMRKLENSGSSEVSTYACGEGPVMVLSEVARLFNNDIYSVVSYSNSGKTLIGKNDRVVGYGAAIYRKDGETTSPVYSDHYPDKLNDELTEEDRKALLHYARNTLEQYYSSQTLPLPRNFSAPIRSLAGAFVTLKKDGMLRGCIGHMAEDTPLCKTVGLMALQAALNDRRFNPVTEDEIPSLEIEISVLTPYSKIGDYKEFVTGRDGILLVRGEHRAVYLPQVAPEQGWDRIETLRHLCQKAGLEESSWKDADLYTFRAIVFSESEYK